jgi:phage/plasmid-like protein (TIGR03299 family)
MTFFQAIETQDVNVAMEAGNHNFEAIKEDMFTGDGLRIPDHVAVLNQTTGEYLGTVGRGYEPVQPFTFYELADELIESTGANINGVINLRGGSTMGLMFHLADREYIAGDPIALNFIMLNGFDGWQGLNGFAPTNRASCLNVCNASNRVYNLKHTKNVLNRVQVIKNMLKYYHNEIASFDEKMNYLVGHRMSQDEAVNWFRSLFSKPTSRRAESRLDNKVSTFIDCLLNGRGSNIAGVRGTSYGAFQALTEYINHHRSIRVTQGREEDEVRFEGIHFGAGNTLTQKGLRSLTSGFTFSAADFQID